MCSILLKVDGSMFNNQYMDIGSTSRIVLSNLFRLMDKDTNLIQIGGETLTDICMNTKYSEGTVRKAMVELNKFKLAEKTDLRGEYIINPLLAIKGNEFAVFDTYKMIEKSLSGRTGEREYGEDMDRMNDTAQDMLASDRRFAKQDN